MREGGSTQCYVQCRFPRESGEGARPLGSGHEVLLQGFNWDSTRCGEQSWYQQLEQRVDSIRQLGITAIWLPPPSDSVSAEGYLPRKLESLDSKYGNAADLQRLVAAFHQVGITALVDCVLNHRCADEQDEAGKWNVFTGEYPWNSSAICCDNAEFGGTGGHKEGEDFLAAPNVDHQNPRVKHLYGCKSLQASLLLYLIRGPLQGLQLLKKIYQRQKDYKRWLKWLKQEIKADGWRFDFVKGYSGRHVRDFIKATDPALAVGEFWDTCGYDEAGMLEHDQDHHRQRTVDWIDSTGGSAAAFDFTTKAILQEALARQQFWRLKDSKSKPPGVIGWWPAHAVTFLDNHDTAPPQQHWPFPAEHLHAGYAYILTHPGMPGVFIDHITESSATENGHSLRLTVQSLIALRKRMAISATCQVVIAEANDEIYAAVVDGKLAVRLGQGSWEPHSSNTTAEWKLEISGPGFAVWGDTSQ